MYRYTPRAWHPGLGCGAPRRGSGVVWTCGARRGLNFGGAQAECGCAGGGSGGPGGSWDEVMGGDRGRLDVDSAGPRGRSEWRGRLRGGLSKSPTLGRGKGALKRI